jgi:hypothetical protein
MDMRCRLRWCHVFFGDGARNDDSTLTRKIRTCSAPQCLQRWAVQPQFFFAPDLTRASMLDMPQQAIDANLQ